MKGELINSMKELLEEAGYDVRKKSKSNELIFAREVEKEYSDKYRNHTLGHLEEEYAEVNKRLTERGNELRLLTNDLTKKHQSHISVNKPKYVDIIIEDAEMTELTKQREALSRLIESRVRDELIDVMKRSIGGDKSAEFVDLNTEQGLKLKIVLKDAEAKSSIPEPTIPPIGTTSDSGKPEVREPEVREGVTTTKEFEGI